MAKNGIINKREVSSIQSSGVWDDEILSTLKVSTFLAKSLPKFHKPSLSNAISWTIIGTFTVDCVSYYLTVSNK